MTTFVRSFRLACRLQSLGPRLMMPSKPFVVVVGSDFSDHAVRALKAAYEQARLHAPAELHVAHATILAVTGADASVAAPFSADFSGLSVESLDELKAELVQHLDTQLAQLPGFRDSGVRVMAHALLESPVFALTRLAEAIEADLIVLGSHGRHGVARWLLGSVAEAVMRQASCPVLVVPPLPSELSVPAIEPACPRCLAERQQTAGAEQWCEQHRARRARPHVYHQADRVSADGGFPLVIHE
jgi:nucleotide-binding universal stress UspA family protein